MIEEIALIFVGAITVITGAIWAKVYKEVRIVQMERKIKRAAF